jgi:hypothetical protein
MLRQSVSDSGRVIQPGKLVFVFCAVMFQTKQMNTPTQKNNFFIRP